MADINIMNSEEVSKLEQTPKDPLLEFHDDTVETVRKLYNLNNEIDLDEAIDILDKWVKEQPHFRKKDFPRKYLEITLISLKGSLERSKQQMEKLCTFKTLLPRYYDISDPIEEFRCFKGKFQQALLPKLTNEHFRIYVVRILSNELDVDFFMTALKYCFAMCEYLKSNDYCDGYVAIVDYSHINVVSYLMKISISLMREAMTLVMDGYQMRVKAIHIITESKTVDVLMAIYKQLLRSKVAQRIHFHKNYDSLHEHLSKEILPVEFGGEEKSIQILHDNTIEVFASEKNMRNLKEMREATVDESLRPEGTGEFYPGMVGTFRTLSID